MYEIHKFERTRGLSWVWPCDSGKILYKIWNSRLGYYGLSYYLTEEAVRLMLERKNER